MYENPEIGELVIGFATLNMYQRGWVIGVYEGDKAIRIEEHSVMTNCEKIQKLKYAQFVIEDEEPWIFNHNGGNTNA